MLSLGIPTARDCEQDDQREQHPGRPLGGDAARNACEPRNAREECSEACRSELERFGPRARDNTNGDNACGE